jgi:hypothetical protein
VTIANTCRSAFALPTDVPPNFITNVAIYSLLLCLLWATTPIHKKIATVGGSRRVLVSKILVMKVLRRLEPQIAGNGTHPSHYFYSSGGG